MTQIISPVSISMMGKYNGVEYESIHIEPRLSEEVIVFSITTTTQKLEKIAAIRFPAHEQSVKQFHLVIRKTLGKTLSVLI